ncbi:MAG: DUF5696 domain-containing protein [Oscillospiraceae bacterium]|nr:DUF5696 domain-containing protein [Oscillospiraceae bacterium]
MKIFMKRILSAALALIFITLIFAACAPSGSGDMHIEIRSFPLDYGGPDKYVFENEFLKLSFDPRTTLFVIDDKLTGAEWTSGPADAAASAVGLTQSVMQSLLVVNYSTIEGNTTLLDSHDFSVMKEFYEYEILQDENGKDNGFAVHFTIGNIERVYHVPKAVPDWRMKEITADMPADVVNRLRNVFYRVYDINRLGSHDNREELIALYSNEDCTPERPLNLENTQIWVMSPDLRRFLKEQAEELFGEYGYTPQDYYNDLEFYERDIQVTEPVFNISIYVELDDYGFNVRVPYDKIQYRGEYPPIDLRVLPFFGAGGPDDEGYMLVPDGSGALISFNNGKSNQSPYSNRVFGWDEAIYREAIILDPKAHFPVFGIENNGNTMLCIIEEGASYATIRAGVSGMADSGTYNNVFADYTLISREKLEISGKSATDVWMFQRSLPEGESIVQRYMFCSRNGYMGMAERYREYLMEQYPHLEKAEVSAVPVAVEIIGSVTKNQHVLGVPVERPYPLTTYNQMADIVRDLNSRSFGEVDYRLVGWFNKSILHEIPTSVNLISRLGSTRDFKSLINTVSEYDSNVFLEADFLFLRQNKPFNGFNLNRDGSRYINRKRIETYPYSFIWYGQMDWWGAKANMARPEYMMGLIDGFMTRISDFGAENVAFRTIGNNLAGDYNEKRFVSRESAMNTQVEKLQELYAAGNRMMIQSGYSYAAPYASFITDFPLSWQGFGILDEEIPFYQIVLHGLVPYAGRPMNLAENFEMNILRSVESGAGLHFAFMDESPIELQTSKFPTFYANQYSMWADTAEALHREFTEQVGDIYNQFITDYIILSNGVSLTEYENGVQVIVNKSSAPFTYDGYIIEAKKYLVLRGER